MFPQIIIKTNIRKNKPKSYSNYLNNLIIPTNRMPFQIFIRYLGHVGLIYVNEIVVGEIIRKRWEVHGFAERVSRGEGALLTLAQ